MKNYAKLIKHLDDLERLTLENKDLKESLKISEMKNSQL